MYNKVVMIGNLTYDVELQTLGTGEQLAKSAIATSYKYKSHSGEQKEEVCFIDFNIFGKPASVFAQYTHKGSKVLLEGRLVFEQWTAQDGSARSKHTLRVDNFKFLDSQQASLGNNYQTSAPQNESYNSSTSQTNHQNRIPTMEDDTDECPF